MASEDSFNFIEGATLLVKKPLKWTSFDVVNKIRYSLKKYQKIKKIKVGHAGTLDPLATGLLVVCTGKATKTIVSIQDDEKEYEGSFFLGATTPSYDRETQIDKEYGTTGITDELVEKATQQFIGKISQKPPMFSAIKVGGEALYKKARLGENVEVKARPVTIKAFEILEINMPFVRFRVACSKGTYIRSIAHDFGESLGCGAHLHSLCRTRIGDYSIKDAWELNDLIDHIKMQPVNIAE